MAIRDPRPYEPARIQRDYITYGGYEVVRTPADPVARNDNRVRFNMPTSGAVVVPPLPQHALLDDLADQITELEHRITELEAELTELKKEKTIPYQTHPKFGRYILVTG